MSNNPFMAPKASETRAARSPLSRSRAIASLVVGAILLIPVFWLAGHIVAAVGYGVTSGDTAVAFWDSWNGIRANAVLLVPSAVIGGLLSRGAYVGFVGFRVNPG